MSTPVNEAELVPAAFTPPPPLEVKTDEVKADDQMDVKLEGEIVTAEGKVDEIDEIDSKSIEEEIMVSITYGDLDHFKDHLIKVTPAPPDLVSRMALKAIQCTKPPILAWCYAQGFSLPDPSLNNEYFHQACDSQSTEIFKVMKENGLDLSKTTREYQGCATALVVASRHGNVPFARWLLENGLDLNDDVNGKAVIHCISAGNCNVEMVQLLIEFGFELKGRGIAIAAAEGNDVRLLETVLEGGAGIEECDIWWLEKRDEFDLEGTPLYRACRSGSLRTVKWLLDKGADWKWKDAIGRNCELIARSERRWEVVEEFKARGLVEEERDTTGRRSRMVSEKNWVGLKDVPDVFMVD